MTGAARPVRAVVFDLGETLVDETRWWADWASYLGVPALTLFALLGVAVARREHHTTALARAAPGADLAAGPKPTVTAADLYPDAVPCLTAMRDAGVVVGVACNCRASAVASLAEAGLPVDVAGSSEGWGVEKPSAAFFARLVAEVGLPAGEIAYVGDRVDNDVLPARDAGLVAVHLRRGPWGAVQCDWPEAAAARHLVGSLHEVVELVRAGRLAAREAG